MDGILTASGWTGDGHAFIAQLAGHVNDLGNVPVPIAVGMSAERRLEDLRTAWEHQNGRPARQ
ncbi:hypothetical protein OHA72_38985 [Dactylosporangium sp. NBC_01737]|uniref:hypothetical protein n=1 Tax=Dactylosporangium sp. NBC_01737 TaxID=2975959 RepID=UPI002E0E4774|nr:hypothetical protein OHA72_38985 [Dactylosporangium sp. NBC_01737]